MVHRQKNFFSSWRSTPLEHGSTHHGEAWTFQIFHVLTFDLIKLAKIGLWLPEQQAFFSLLPEREEKGVGTRRGTLNRLSSTALKDFLLKRKGGDLRSLLQIYSL